MKRTGLITLALLLMALAKLYAQQDLTKLFSTGIYGGGQLDLVVNSSIGEEILTENQGTINSLPMQIIWENNAWQTATISVPNSGHIGFRNASGYLRVNPIYWGGSSAPDPAFYTPLETDPTGDHLYTSAWLDITSTKVSFTQDRLYFAINNNHTSFPVSSGLTYFAYMPVLVDPDAAIEDNPIVYGLMYTVSVPGVISPGLYKVTGSGFSGLTQLGSIEHQVVGQTLLLSCALGDLLADADFSSWFNPAYPRVATTTTTSRITLINGIQQSDITAGAQLLLKPQSVPLVNVSAPVLSGAGCTEYGSGVISPYIYYSDADNNFPRTATVSINGGEFHPLVPQSDLSNGFVSPVLYVNPVLYAPSGWSELNFRFSHGDSFVESVFYNSSNNQDLIANPLAAISLYPNPVANQLTVKSASGLPLYMDLFNLKGQKLGSYFIAKDNTDLQIDVSGLKPGIYFFKTSGTGKELKRFVKL